MTLLFSQMHLLGSKFSFTFQKPVLKNKLSWGQLNPNSANSHVKDTVGFHTPGFTLITVATWGTNQQMEALSLCVPPSVCKSTFPTQPEATV